MTRARPPHAAAWTPTPPELEHAPELAVLAALDHVVDIAVYTLLAVHPYLGDDDSPYRSPTYPDIQAAGALLDQSLRLQGTLARYRDILAKLHAADAVEQADAERDDHLF